MDGIEMEDSYACNENKKISLKLTKDLSSRNWLINKMQKSSKKSFKKKPEHGLKTRPSLKVSLPIAHYIKATMQKNQNLGINSPKKTEDRRNAQQFELLQLLGLPQHSEQPQQSGQPQQMGQPQQPWQPQQQAGQLLGQKSGLSRQSSPPEQPRLPQHQEGQPSELLLQKLGQPRQSSPLQQPKLPQHQAGQPSELPQQSGIRQKLGIPQQSSLPQQPRLPQQQVGEPSESPQYSQQTRLVPRQSGLPKQAGLPQQSGSPVMTPTPLSPSSLRMFHHPVPTSKRRTMFADEYDQFIKTCELNPPELNDSTIPHYNTPLSEEPVELTVEESKTKTTPISVKHKLPLTVMERKGCYTKRTCNPVYKDNRLTTSTPPTTYERATQTEKVFIITEEYNEILQLVENSGLTKAELQNRLNEQRLNEQRLDEQRQINSDNDCVVIDLENTEENNNNKDILETLLEYSTNNKNKLIAAAQMMQMHTDQAPPIVPSANLSTVSTCEPPPAESVPPTTAPEPAAHFSCLSMHPCDEVLIKSLLSVATLQKYGFRNTNTALETRHTYIPRTDTNVTQTTKTEDESDNSKRRKLHSTNENSSELIAHLENNYERPSVVRPPQDLLSMMPVMPQREPELPVFRPQMPHQLPQAQAHQFVPDHPERPAQYYTPNMRGLMPQHRPPFTVTRNTYQYPYEHNSNSTLRTPQLQLQMPSPVPHVDDPWAKRNRRNQARGLPHLSRVLSTDEANLHSQALHPEFNWACPPMYDRRGNVYPQRHQ